MALKALYFIREKERKAEIRRYEMLKNRQDSGQFSSATPTTPRDAKILNIDEDQN